ncbi:hypothetical protein DYB25_008563 [Aphanomyces astaci]|uniref:HAT C-terminal dimerisation domain-containing protein n=5 Tax=Aphanomyces astaci TaxID=112090 RepID=A0A397EP32_APHAT|nr:hypothetical protein DYB36_009371 [Aphanomyces astaci]RHY25337.1 hypothetical protein DYB25_008563 [Aphanomyces astaci]RHY75870.1 hypothetical protein DYB30_002322 [Aphanomyces astaci]RHY88439.1 hypothetical protein DYB31_009333 [Aphanomyces astaci]
MGATVFAYSGGTSTMTRHLRRKHGIFAPGKSEQDYERPSSTVPSFTTAMLTSFFDKSDEGGGGEPYRPPKCAGHNNVMAHTSRYLKLQHTRHTMQWIQFATTQYTSLHLDADLHTVLRKGNGSFQPLQGPPLVAALMDLMQGQRTALREYMDAVRPPVSLSVEAWPSASKCLVHVVTAHWITDDFQLRECVLDTMLLPAADAQNGDDFSLVVTWLLSTVEQWNLLAVDSITVKPSWSSSALALAFPNANIVPCLVHQVDSVMQTVLSVYSSLLIKARRLVLAAAPLNVPLHLDHSTHWSSSLSMVQQPSILTHPSWTPDEAQRLHQLISILAPVHSLLEQIANTSDDPNIGPCPPLASLAFGLLHGVVKLLQDKPHASAFVPLLQATLQSPPMRRVCALDPRFKSLPFLSPSEKQDTLDTLQRAISSKRGVGVVVPPLPSPAASSHTPAVPPPTSSWTELYPFEDTQPTGDLQMYLDAAAHDLVDPLAWWKVHRHVYPDLAKVARKLLSMRPCAGVAAEVLTTPDVLGRKQAIPTGLIAAYMFVRSALRVPELAVLPEK